MTIPRKPSHSSFAERHLLGRKLCLAAGAGVGALALGVLATLIGLSVEVTRGVGAAALILLIILGTPYAFPSYRGRGA